LNDLPANITPDLWKMQTVRQISLGMVDNGMPDFSVLSSSQIQLVRLLEITTTTMTEHVSDTLTDLKEIGRDSCFFL